jgi:ribonucleotide reductase alpha subunit
MNVKELFKTEICEEMSELNKMELGSDEYKATISGVTQLTDRYTKMIEVENEKLKIENERKRVESEKLKNADEQYARKVKNWIDVATLVISFGVPVSMTIVSLVAEEKGILNITQPGKKFMDRCLNFGRK